MSRPKKFTTKGYYWLPPDLNAWLGEYASAQGLTKSGVIRLWVKRAKEGGTPAAPTPEKSSPTMKPPPGRIAFTPRPREDDEEKYPWRKFGFTEEEWDTIPEEDQDKLKRGEAQALPRRRKP